jgi:hypothetical protein
MSGPSTLVDIRNKVRRITGRPSASQITDPQINDYINTFYLNDMPEHLRLESLRVNFQFVTNANQPVYDFPRDFYLDNMPPVYIGGYQSYMTQSRENFFRINPQLNLLQQVATGNGTVGPYVFTLTNTPITPGFKPNPPGAYSTSIINTSSDIVPAQINWNVLISGVNGLNQSICLVDDGQGNLFDINDFSSDPIPDPAHFPTPWHGALGSINYLTGAVTATFSQAIAVGANISAQYIPYVASRPQSCAFYQDQFYLYPVPSQAFTVSFEAFKYPTALAADTDKPQLREWWQMLAYGAADKIFADNGDIENLQKFRPLLEEQIKLVQRRTIVQYTSERTASIYTEQTGYPQYPFGNIFSGF